MFGHASWVQAVAFDPVSALLISGSKDRTIRLWELQGSSLPGGSLPSSRKVRTLQGHAQAVESLAVNAKGMFLASVASDENVLLWDLRAGKLSRTLQASGLLLEAVAFSPDGRLLASGAQSGAVVLWSVAEASP